MHSREGGAAILKQPEALAGAVQQDCAGFGEEGGRGGVGIVFRLATVTIYSAKGNTGGEIDTECLSQCSFLDGIRTVRMSLDLHFCGVDYMLWKNPWLETFARHCKEKLCQMTNELPCGAQSQEAPHTFDSFSRHF